MNATEKLKEQTKDIIRELLERSPWDAIDWDTALEQTHEVIHSYLVSQITDTGESDWLYDASELVTYNIACRFIEELKDSKWFSDTEHDVKQDAFDQQELARDPDGYYGVPRR